MYINCVAVWSHSHIISLIMDSRLLDSEVVEYVRKTLGITDEVRASSVIAILTQDFHCEDCFGPKDWSDIV